MSGSTTEDMNCDNNSEEDIFETEYVDLADAVEVPVDDSQVPMDEDYDDDDDYNVLQNTELEVDAQRIQSEPLTDMSLYSFSAHSPSAAYAVACHLNTNNELVVISGGGDDRAVLHQATQQQQQQQQQQAPLKISLIHSHTDSVSCVATNLSYLDSVHNTQPYVAVGSYDGSIVIYDPSTTAGNLVSSLTPIMILDGPTDVEFLTFHPNGGSVLLAGSIEDGTLWMFHLPTKKCMQVFVGHECHTSGGGVTAGCFTPDGKLALSVGMDGTMRLWAPRTGQCKHVFHLHNSNSQEGQGLLCLGIDGGVDGQLVIAGSENGLAHVVHWGSRKVVATLRHFNDLPATGQHNAEPEDAHRICSVEAVAFAPRKVHPHWVATGGSDGVLKIWDLTHGTGQCRQTCRVTEEQGSCLGITKIAWHHHIPMIISSYADGFVRFWDARNGQLLHSLCGGRSQTMTQDDMQINDMAIQIINDQQTGLDSIWISTAHDDGSIKVFHVQTKDIFNI